MQPKSPDGSPWELGLWLGEFGEGPRKQRFALDWVLSGNGAILWSSILVLSVRRTDQIKAKVTSGKEAAVIHISQEREMFSILWLFLSVFG